MFGNTSTTLSDAAYSLVRYLVGPLVWLLSGVALLIFLFGMVRFIYHGADQKGYTDGKQLMIWGITALFIIFSLGGILSFLCLNFLNSASCGGASTPVWPGT